MKLDEIKREHALIMATVLMCTLVYVGGSFIGGYYLAQALIFAGGAICGAIFESTTRG